MVIFHGELMILMDWFKGHVQPENPIVQGKMCGFRFFAETNPSTQGSSGHETDAG